MSILRMAWKKEDIPAHAPFHDVSDSYRPQPDPPNAERIYWTPEKCAAYELYIYETHKGFCLQDSERNGYHDSDFLMLVWDAETWSPKTIEFASTRGWSYPCYGSKPDALPTIRAVYENWMRIRDREARIRRDIEQAALPKWGREVRIVKGRKHPIGLEGDVFWASEPVRSKYNPFEMPKSERIGLRLKDGSRIFIAAANVEVINPDRYRETQEQA